jgi:hypothetical protein
MLGSPPQRPLAFAVPTTHEFIFEIAGVPVLAFFCASMSSVFAQVSLELGLSQREGSGTSSNLRKRVSATGPSRQLVRCNDTSGVEVIAEVAGSRSKRRE